MTDQATDQTTAQQPYRPAPAKHDTLAVLGFALGLIGLGIFILIPRTAEAQARRDRERAERQQPEQLTENQDTVR